MPTIKQAKHLETWFTAFYDENREMFQPEALDERILTMLKFCFAAGALRQQQETTRQLEALRDKMKDIKSQQNEAQAKSLADYVSKL